LVNLLTERRLQFNVGTNKTSGIDKEGERHTVPTPLIGDETPLALIIKVLEQLREKLVNLWGSQVIWLVVLESIIHSLPLVTTKILRAELDISDLVTNPTAVEIWLLEVASTLVFGVVLPFGCQSG